MRIVYYLKSIYLKKKTFRLAEYSSGTLHVHTFLFIKWNLFILTVIVYLEKQRELLSIMKMLVYHLPKNRTDLLSSCLKEFY